MPLSEAQVTTEACYFKSVKAKRWHRILKYYPGPARMHIAYCGRIESVNRGKLMYAGVYNNQNEVLLKDWKDCRKCDFYYKSVVQSSSGEA